MTVSLRIASESSGVPFALPEGMGTMSPGEASSALNVYISHTGTAKIENAKIYILPYSAGVYVGSFTAQDDYDTVIEWGDDSYPATSGGGLYLNMNYSGGFPSGEYVVFRTGWGDSLGNAVTLSANAINIGTGSAGEIPASGEAHIRLRVDVPSGYSGSAGTQYVDVLIDYSATS